MSESEKTAKENEQESRLCWEIRLRPFIKIALVFVFLLIGGYALTDIVQSAAKCLYNKSALAKFTWEQVVVILGAMLSITVILLVIIQGFFRVMSDD